MTRTEYDLTIEYTDPKTPDYTYHFEHRPRIEVLTNFVIIHYMDRTSILHEREVRSMVLSTLEVPIPEGEASSRPEPDGRPVPLSNS